MRVSAHGGRTDQPLVDAPIAATSGFGAGLFAALAAVVVFNALSGHDCLMARSGGPSGYNALMASPDGDEYAVHVDRPRVLVVGALFLAVSLGLAWWLSPLGLVGVPVALIMLLRCLDPRPQLVLTSEGATFGGLLKSTWGRDVTVPWSEIHAVTLKADPVGEPPRLIKSMPMAPPGLTRMMKELIPPARLDVETNGGRRLSVYPPGRHLTLEQVEREITRRWQRAVP